MCALSLFKKINKYLFATIIIILLYLCCTSIAYADITIKTTPTNLVVNHTNDEMKIITEFNLPNGGNIGITNNDLITIFGNVLSDVGTSSGDGNRLTITIDDSGLINDILSAVDPVDIEFPETTLSNGASDANTSDIYLSIVAPPNGTSFTIDDINKFEAHTTLTTSGAGTHILTFLIRLTLN